MGEMMNFPETFDEFAELYKTVDTKQVYSNGIEFIPRFRVEQWLEHENALTNHKHHKRKHCFLNHTVLHIIIHLAFHLVLHGVLEHIVH